MPALMFGIVCPLACCTILLKPHIKQFSLWWKHISNNQKILDLNLIKNFLFDVLDCQIRIQFHTPNNFIIQNLLQIGQKQYPYKI